VKTGKKKNSQVCHKQTMGDHTGFTAESATPVPLPEIVALYIAIFAFIACTTVGRALCKQ
jgi:hypothetical protein